MSDAFRAAFLDDIERAKHQAVGEMRHKLEEVEATLAETTRERDLEKERADAMAKRLEEVSNEHVEAIKHYDTHILASDAEKSSLQGQMMVWEGRAAQLQSD